MHDLHHRRLAGAAFHGGGGTDDRPHLHLVDLGEEEAEPAPARAEHRVRLAERADPARHLGRLRLLERRQELVQRRVEEPDRDRQAGHRLEDPLEVLLLEGEQLRERVATLLLPRCHDHRAHERQALLGHEHVLGPAEPDPLGAELPRLGRVGRSVGIGPHLQAADLVGPAQQVLEVLVDVWRNEIDRPDDDVAGAAVDGDHVALGELAGRRSSACACPDRWSAPRTRPRRACPCRGRRPRRARSCRPAR